MTEISGYRAASSTRTAPASRVVNTDGSGEPTGLISEAAVNWARMNIPEQSRETLEHWYGLAVDRMIKYGVTSVQTDDLEMAGGVDGVFDLYESLARAYSTSTNPSNRAERCRCA